MTTKRERIGSATSAVTRLVIYRTPDAIEVDSLEWVEIRRSRVFFDDVLLVTYHQETGIGVPIFLTLMTGLFGMIATLLAFSGAAGAALFFFAITALFGTPLLIRLISKLDVITVYGRRSKARIQFALRKERARQLFEEICTSARAAQPERSAELPSVSS